MIQVIRNKLEEEIVFVTATVLAIGTSFIIRPRIGAIDPKVILSLFNLMLMSLAFEKYHLLDSIAVFILNKANTQKAIGGFMILTTAVLGMFMTNDVALLTVVPITMAMGRKGGFDPFKIVVLETAAANIGSSLTPFGNPQNLYLYDFYKMNTLEFFRTIGPFVTVGLILLLLVNMKTPGDPLNSKLHKVRLKHPVKLIIYSILFVLVLASVLRIIHYMILSALVFLTVLILDRKLMKKVDFFLLGTFVSFFIFIDNVTRMEWVHTLIRGLINTPLKAFGTSVVLSQVISNVPTAILLSGFTHYSRSVFIGVSVGGLGTLIASLANLISFKIYLKSHGKQHYQRYFYKLNISLLIVLGVFMGIWVHYGF